MKPIMMLLIDGHEECEALVTYDLLKRAGLEVCLVSLNDELGVTSSHAITYNAHKLLSEVDLNDYSALILPGGMPGVTNLDNLPIVHKIIDYFNQDNRLISAICAAPMILLKDGYLKDDEFTCYPGFELNYKRADQKVVVHNNFITASGLGASFEFSQAIATYLGFEKEINQVLKEISYK